MWLVRGAGSELKPRCVTLSPHAFPHFRPRFSTFDFFLNLNQSVLFLFYTGLRERINYTLRFIAPGL